MNVFGDEPYLYSPFFVNAAAAFSSFLSCSSVIVSSLFTSDLPQYSQNFAPSFRGAPQPGHESKYVTLTLVVLLIVGA